MGKFTEDARELLAAIGGRENIAAVSHCITRMRYVLVDPKIADIPRIEAIPSVKGSESGNYLNAFSTANAAHPSTSDASYTKVLSGAPSMT